MFTRKRISLPALQPLSGDPKRDVVVLAKAYTDLCSAINTYLLSLEDKQALSLSNATGLDGTPIGANDATTGKFTNLTSTGTASLGSTVTIGTLDASNGAAKKTVEWLAGGFAAPGGINVASNGDKGILYRSSSFDAGYGIAGSTLWFKSLDSGGTAKIEWYTGSTGSTPNLSLDGDGKLTAAAACQLGPTGGASIDVGVSGGISSYKNTLHSFSSSGGSTVFVRIGTADVNGPGIYIDGTTTVLLKGLTSATASAGGTAIPTAAGFLECYIGGSKMKIPYCNA